MKQKPLSILESTVPDNLHPVVLKNWLRNSLNVNADFEQILICEEKSSRGLVKSVTILKRVK